MTSQEINEAIRYFNSIRNSERILIEAEMRHRDKQRFDDRYLNSTGNTVPSNSSQPPYYVWDPNAEPDSKWGIELRIYFVSDNNTPQALLSRTRNNSRHGYNRFDKRINYNKLVWEMFNNGFLLGQN